ncbi:MAG: DNA modification methylase [Planctomycetes bacterium]|nr:DNA modification methylase [Planctomycetota bacterium]
MRVESRRVAELLPAAYNPRQISEQALAGLGESIGRFGLVQPVIVNARTGHVVGGHQRLKVLESRGVEATDVVVVDLPELEEKALNLALNSQAISGEWTDAALALVEQVARELPDLSAALRMGDLEEALRDLFPAEAAAVVEDDVPEPPDDPVTKPGDLWVLGDHRLLCGDSGSEADLDRLLGGARVHLLNTDPPYNVKVEPRSNNAIRAGLSSFSAPEKHHHQALDLARHPGKSKPTTRKMRAKDRPLANDFVPDEAFEGMLRAWFGNASRVLVPGRAAYIWGGYANVSNYPPALREAGLYFSQTIIWDKQHPVLTRKDFMGAHEWCFYCWKEGAAHVFYGPANVPDLWVVKKVTPQKMVHLTEKPVELAARALQYSSKSGENVLDLFGGSGSTLMACEQLGRHGFLMELDPAYCDVIVQRWEAATGRKGHSTCARATPSPRPRSGGRRHRDPSRPAPDAHGQATAPRLVARERAPWRAAPEARAAPCAVLARQGRQDRVRRGCASAR